ncbi:ATPase [Terasakiella brassicae]|uniref:ATPase n=2 Tax=Terasakiella brassicae TaxID=1634917 RepID=A0A917FBZ7_9PROT|nr:ATPase [Terasakiella brassicae]
MKDDPKAVQALEALSKQMATVHREVNAIIFGQDQVIEEALVSILSGGHVLLIGLPGLGKTRLVETLGTVLGLDERRVQFTPDLMPGDIIGSEILDEDDNGKRHFRFVKGPTFCQLLMADEINRASPRTQSALLQAMQEKRVSVAGHYHDLPQPFHVLATQNPLEQEGTYPLPEAQLDRFFMEINVQYPERDAERAILMTTTGNDNKIPKRICSSAELLQAQSLLRDIPVGESVVEAILTLVREGRPETSTLNDVQKHVAWGPGPRASQALMSGVRARCVLHNRLCPSIDDVIALASPILRHRMALNFAARAEGVSLDTIIEHLITRTLNG